MISRSAIGRFGATICFTAPTAYRAHSAPPAGLRSRTSCAAASRPANRSTEPPTTAGSRPPALPLTNVIGGTEMLHAYLGAADADIRPGSLGKPLLGYEARVVDEEGRELPPGTLGRLAVRGPLGCRYLADARQSSYVRQGLEPPGRFGARR